MAIKKLRQMKVYGQSGYHYKETPAIVLKGNWLQELGFEIGDFISVSCENGKLIITPDAERAVLAEAETFFMVQETKKLQRRFEQEKARFYAQFVAEQRVQYGVCEEVQ